MIAKDFDLCKTFSRFLENTKNSNSWPSVVREVCKAERSIPPKCNKLFAQKVINPILVENL